LSFRKRPAISKTTVQIHKRLAWQAWIRVTKSNPSTLFVTVVASREQLFVSKINASGMVPCLVLFYQQNQQRNIGPEDKACLARRR
jgi:hypothetical protein